MIPSTQTQVATTLVVKLSPTFGEEDPPFGEEDVQPRGMKNVSLHPSKVEAQIDFSMYDGIVEGERLDN